MQFGSTVLFVDDVRPVLEFWQRAFGFTLRFYDEGYGYGELDAGGVVVAFGSHRSGELMMPGAYRRPAGGGPDGVEIAFYTDDVAGAFERAVAAGATPVAPPSRMAWGQTVAYVRSIEGTVVGFCTPQAPVTGE